MRSRTAALLAAVIGLVGCGGSGEADDRAAEPNEDPTAYEELSDEGAGRRAQLAEVEHWSYLIDVDLEADTVDDISESDHDLVVVDFIPSEQQNTDYPMAEVVDRLHGADGARLVLAYIDIGQAEDYRTYWEPDWQIGDPDWIVSVDPDGWEGNYPVEYWRSEWQDIWLGDDGLVSQVREAGFDGIYLDWVEAYDDDNVAAAAEADGVDAESAMVEWIAALAETGRDGDPGFLVVGQNAAELALDSPAYRESIDAVAQEQVWFDGGADNDPPGDCPLPATEDDVETAGYEASLSGGCLELHEDFAESTLHVSSEWYLDTLTALRDLGIPVFTVDYAEEPDNVAVALENARELGFTPFVGRRSLDTFEPVR